MMAKPYRFDGVKEWHPCEPEEATHVKLALPCPCLHLMLPIMIGGKREGTNNWTWNGDAERPTLKPSVLTTGGDYICHSWINNGAMIFLNDTGPTGEDKRSHAGFAGRTLELLEVNDDC